MKKSVFSVLLSCTLVATFSFVTLSCGGSDKETDASDSTMNLIPDTAKVEHDGFAATTNIRYVDLDSILSGYEYARQEMAKLEKKSFELQQYQNSLTAQVQKKANEIQQKGNNNGYLSQQSYEADMQEYQTMVQRADANYGKRAQELSIEMAKVQETVIKAIENYIIKYNKTKKYDAILLKNAGVYFNPSLDITAEIVEGLNAQTQSVAATDDASKK